MKYTFNPISFILKISGTLLAIYWYDWKLALIIILMAMIEVEIREEKTK
jgi:hypothetical protein